MQLNVYTGLFKKYPALLLCPNFQTRKRLIARCDKKWCKNKLVPEVDDPRTSSIGRVHYEITQWFDIAIVWNAIIIYELQYHSRLMGHRCHRRTSPEWFLRRIFETQLWPPALGKFPCSAHCSRGARQRTATFDSKNLSHENIKNLLLVYIDVLPFSVVPQPDTVSALIWSRFLNWMLPTGKQIGLTES